MKDDDIEDVVLELIKKHLSDDAREVALKWLRKRIATYRAVHESGLLGDDSQSDIGD